MTDYTLYIRKTSGRSMYYYYTYDKKGKRLPGKTTKIGFTNQKDKARKRREAESYCRELSKHGSFKPVDSPILREWIEKKQFWNWRKSSYIRGILARSPKEKPGITETYCRKCEQVTVSRIIPAHGRKRIHEITPYDCEQLLFKWQGEGYAPATVNNWKYVYSTILGEYEREMKMRDTENKYFNPWKLVKPLGASDNRYGGLTVNEVQRIVYRGDIDATKGKYLYYLACKIAFLTGLRMGEVCGLYTDDIIDENIGENVRMSYLLISKNYDFVLKKRTLPKDKDIRQIPISAKLREEIQPFLTGPERFLLSPHPEQRIPLSPGSIRKWLYARMEDIGIFEEERIDRHLAFHSARRFFNTLMRSANVADSTIQRFTGHNSDSMTEHYTDYLPEDLQEISRAQERLLED